MQSIPLPTTTIGSNRRLIASGTATSEGLITRSADGAYIVLTGYDAEIPTVSLTGTTAASTPRVVGRVAVDGSLDTSTALSDFSSGSNPRSVASSDGTNFWVTGGAGGIRYATLTATTSTQLSTTLTNLRQTSIFDGQLYVTTASGSAVRLGTVGTGTPTTSGQTITNLPGFPTAGGPYGFFFADLDAGVAGNDTVYVADDTANQVQKYCLVSGSWAARGTVAATGVRGVTGVVAGSTVTLYMTTGASVASGGGTLWTLADTSGYDANLVGAVSVLATAATNTAFRGIALAPAQRTLTISDVTEDEGDSGTTAFTFTVTLSQPAGAGGVSFDVATAADTATAGSDYTTLSVTSQTIAEGNTTKTFDVQVNGDGDVEPDETFFLDVTNVTGALVGDAQGLGTITNDDIALRASPSMTCRRRRATAARRRSSSP